MLDATERGNRHSAFFQDHISRYFPGKSDPEIERDNCEGQGGHPGGVTWLWGCPVLLCL